MTIPDVPTITSSRAFASDDAPPVAFAAGFTGADAYDPGRPPSPDVLRLDRNEGAPPDVARIAALAIDADAARRYPGPAATGERLAVRLGLDPARVLITAGGDDAIDRVCRLVLDASRSAVIHVPGFEMIERSVRVTGAAVRRVPWEAGAFPVEAFLAAADATTRLFCIVSPNNPTGAAATTADVRRVARARPDAAVLVDLAYTEFAGDRRIDWRSLLDEPNVLFVRTFSKAWGLAALRLGWMVGSAPMIRGAQAAGGPFAVSGPSLAVLDGLLAEGVRPDRRRIDRVADERVALARRLRAMGADLVPESAANFVYARWASEAAASDLVRDLAETGVRIRRLGDGAVRITCPGDAGEWARLDAALEAVASDERPLAMPRSMPADVPSDVLAEPARGTSAGASDPANDPIAPAVATVTASATDPSRVSGSDAPRRGSVRRATRETSVSVELDLDGAGRVRVDTGLGLVDHFVTALALHARFDLDLQVRGDLHVDDHHTIEDAAIVLGQAFDAALGDRRGIVRFADAHAPLDESLARAVVDCSGRPGAWIDLDLRRPAIGAVGTENLTHFLQSFATSARCTVHVDVLRGENDHHRAEAGFKALALALRRAVATDPVPRMPSTKGTLT